MDHPLIECRIIRSKRRTAAFSITREGEILFRIPRWVTDQEAQRLIRDNQDKLRVLVEKWELSQATKPIYRDEDIPPLKALAAEKLPPRVEYWAKRMGLTPASVKITSAKTRFGSCSSRGSVCFSCFVMLYPDDAIDYVIVHELAHLKHLNHSAAFYRLVATYLPDYRRREAILKGRTR
ncbi:MAG: M48 family metallopeptidase [Clostridia bacterium]|nr:M48 family metallopeptidase [Clostridia bacterium]